MSARSARILLALLVFAPAAEAGWLGGDRFAKKLPEAVSMVELRAHDAHRLKRPSKVFPRIDSKIADPNWGGPGAIFYRSGRMKVSHQNKY